MTEGQSDGKKISRRDLLGLGVKAAGALALSGCADQALVKAISETLTPIAKAKEAATVQGAAKRATEQAQSPLAEEAKRKLIAEQFRADLAKAVKDQLVGVSHFLGWTFGEVKQAGDNPGEMITKKADLTEGSNVRTFPVDDKKTLIPLTQPGRNFGVNAGHDVKGWFWVSTVGPDNIQRDYLAVRPQDLQKATQGVLPNARPLVAESRGNHEEYFFIDRRALK